MALPFSLSPVPYYRVKVKVLDYCRLVQPDWSPRHDVCECWTAEFLRDWPGACGKTVGVSQQPLVRGDFLKTEGRDESRGEWF